MSETATKLPAEADEEHRNHEPSPTEGGNRVTFLVALHYGDTEAVAGGTMTGSTTEVIIAARHVPPSVPARIKVRLRGGANSEMASRLEVTLNGVRVGEVAFESDGEFQSLVVPSGLLIEGSNIVTLAPPSASAASTGARSPKASNEGSR